MSHDWMVDAACRKADPELFFPERAERAAPAKAICARCDVTADCLAFAKTHGIEHGIWGGLSEKQRRGGPLPLRRCLVCGVKFRPDHGLVLICSDLCRATNHATKSRQRRAAA